MSQIRHDLDERDFCDYKSCILELGHRGDHVGQDDQSLGPGPECMSRDER